MELKHFMTRGRRLVHFFLPALAQLFQNLFWPDSSLTQYPDAEHKSKRRIAWEHFLWYLRFQEVNSNYYAYGLDRKDAGSPWNYGGHINLRDKRNEYNHRHPGRDRTSYCGLISDKFTFGIYLTALGFPTPRILAICDRDHICWEGSWREEPLETVLERENLDVFCKEVLGGCGKEVFPVQVKQGVLYVDRTQATVEEFRKQLCGRYVLQERLIQHPSVSLLYGESVNTVRLVTILEGKTPVVFAAAVRVGGGGRYVDNLHAGGLIGGIDLSTGRLSPNFIERAKHRTLTHHPDTNIAFGSVVYPFIPEAVQMCLRLHTFFYGIHSIGWDIALSETGPTLIEANDEWDFPLLQMVNGGLKDRFFRYRPVPSSRGTTP